MDFDNLKDFEDSKGAKMRYFEPFEVYGGNSVHKNGLRLPHAVILDP